MSLQVAILALVWSAYKTPPNSYFSGSRIKYERLKNAEHPRLVFVGGSGTAMGLDSRILEDHLDYSVVNAGLYLGLGFDFMLQEVLPELAPGDAVVLSLEYEGYCQRPEGTQILWLIEINPEARRGLCLSHVPLLLDDGFLYLSLVTRRAFRRMIRREAVSNETGTARVFNPYGDYVEHWGMPRDEFRWTTRRKLDPSRLVLGARLDAIERFTRECAKKGVRVLYSYPPVPESMAWAYRDLARSLRETLGRISDLRQIDAPDDGVYPDALFFGTRHHLTYEGIQRRMAALIPRLKAVLASRSP